MLALRGGEDLSEKTLLLALPFVGENVAIGGEGVRLLAPAVGGGGELAEKLLLLSQ